MNEPEYVLVTDHDGHHYVVLVSDLIRFYEALNSDDPEFGELDVNEVGGAPSLVKFKQWRIE